MDHVLLLPKHLTNTNVTIKTEGNWVNGEWIEGEKTEVVFKAGIFPLRANDFKNYPEGILKNDDRKLITKRKLNIQDEIFIDNKKFIIVLSQQYEYLADINYYIIRESKVV